MRYPDPSGDEPPTHRGRPGTSYDARIHEPIPYPEPSLTGGTFVLRPFREDDFEAALALERDAAAARWVPALPAADGAGVVAFYADCRREGGLLHLVIADRLTDAYLGEAMLALSEHGVGEVGCCVVPAARRRRLATEAVVTLTDWSFATLGLDRVQVFVATENVVALRVAESAGFLHEGVLRSYWEVDGERVDVLVLSRLPGDEFGVDGGTRRTSAAAHRA
jgi:RimJ/RimL family protein N-acetyltransferase